MTKIKKQKRERFSTVAKAFERDAAYWGERHEWYIVLGTNRDADTISESNFEVLKNELADIGNDGESYAVEEASHWACGWVRYLIIPPDNKAALRIAINASKRIEQYPILDEDHFCNLEHEKFYEFAKGELDKFEHWDRYLYLAQRDGNYSIGNDDDEWNLIEAVRKVLKQREELVELQASCPIDPNQRKFFDDVPHL